MNDLPVTVRRKYTSVTFHGVWLATSPSGEKIEER